MLTRLMLAGVLAVGLAQAQRPATGGGGMGDDMGSGGMNRRPSSGEMEGSMPTSMQRRAPKAEQMADKLKLDKGQREECAKILSAARERAVSARLDLDKQRAQIAGAMVRGDADGISKALAAYTPLAAQMTKVEADAFAKIYALLKPNQQAKADQAFELLAGVFNPQGVGRGAGAGAGMGRGRGGR